MSNKIVISEKTTHNSVDNPLKEDITIESQAILQRPAGRERPRVTLKFTKPSLTKQANKDETDINLIMKRYGERNVLETFSKIQNGQFGDFVDARDYHDSVNTALLAQNMFDALPASLRKKFANDPAEFLAFVDNPENAEELAKLGLQRPSKSSGGEATSPPPEGPPASKNPPPTGDDNATSAQS